jgi:hypothetical protein
MLQDELRAQAALGSRPDLNGGLHHRAKAKRVIQLFMNGGVSQTDTFDYKPGLIKYSGQKFDPGPGQKVESVTGSPGFIVMKSPYTWKQHGQCGRWVSEVLPQISTCVDDLAFLMAMTSKTNVHGPAVYQQNSGFTLPGFPCMGAWLSYGLGKLNENVPAVCRTARFAWTPIQRPGELLFRLPAGGASGHTGPSHGSCPINDLFAPKSATYITKESEEEGLALLGEINREHLSHWQGDSRLEARIASYELAAKMQLSIPGVFDISKESDETRKLYGLDEKDTEDFGRSCLIRSPHAGTRVCAFVQVWSGTNGASGNWDNHSNIRFRAGASSPNAPTPAWRDFSKISRPAACWKIRW